MIIGFPFFFGGLHAINGQHATHSASQIATRSWPEGWDGTYMGFGGCGAAPFCR